MSTPIQRSELDALKPRKQMVTMDEAGRWRADDFLIQRKYDGDFRARQYGHALLLGELVRPKSGAFRTAEERALLNAHGSFFAAFTVASIDGRDMLKESTRARWAELQGLFAAKEHKEHKAN